MMGSWKSSPLGRVATLQRGFDLPHRLRRAGDIPIVTSSGIEDVHSEARARAPGVVTGRYGTIGKVFLLTEDFWPLNTTLFVKDFHGNDPRFVSYLLRTIDFETHSGKTGVPGVNRNDLHEIEVGIPPTLIEQQAIAEALSDADALIESLEQLLAKKHQIKQGAMQELLTGNKRLPGFGGPWEQRALKDLCVKIQDGTHFSPKLGGNDFLYVTSKNVGFGTLDLSTAQRISATEHAKIYRRCDVAKDDLLLTKDGANTGNAAINTIAEPFSLLSSVAMLRFDPKRYAVGFFLYQILSDSGQRQIDDLMSGNAITRLTLAKIRSLKVPVAPHAEQLAITEVLADMGTEITAVESRLGKARQIKQGMMQELLTGRIRLI